MPNNFHCTGGFQPTTVISTDLRLENCVGLRVHVKTINYETTGKWTEPGDLRLQRTERICLHLHQY